MIYWIVIFILVVILFLTRITDKVVINPIKITAGIWLFLLLAYNLTNHGLYPLSDKFYASVVLWVVPMFCVYIILYFLFSAKKSYLKFYPSKFIYSQKFICFFIFISLVYVVFKVNEVRSHGSDYFFHALREIAGDKANGEMEVSILERSLSRILQFSYLLWLTYLCRGTRFKYQYIFYGLVFIQFLLGANKFYFVRFFVGYFAILIAKNKISPRKFFIYSVSFVLLMSTLNYFRLENSDSFDLLNDLQIYFLSPLPAFDTYILHSSSAALFTTEGFGEHVFASLRGEALMNPDYFENDNLVFVPLPTNVFTVLSAYYIDFGNLGIICASIFFGTFFSFLYFEAKHNEAFLVLYAALLYILVVQFFFDFLITSQARPNILLMIVSLFVLYHPSIKNSKLLNKKV